MSKKIDYVDKAKETAADAVRDLLDEIATQIIESGEANTNINDCGRTGEEIESGWSDKWYTPREAVKCFEDLDEYEETDGGLWSGKDWKDMLSAKAAFTFRNGCYHFFSKLIKEINEEIDIDNVKDDLKKERLVDMTASISSQHKELDEQALDDLIEDKFTDWLESSEGKAIFKNKITAIVKKIADAYHL